MEEIKSFITTLISILILITAMELISPDNSLKKYIKFILGIIIIAIIITPIVNFFREGEDGVENLVNKYMDIEYKEDSKENIEDVNTRNTMFKKNLEENCNKILSEKFVDMKFESNIDCDIDTYNIDYSINSVEVKVSDKKVSKIKEVIINRDDNSKEVASNNEKIEKEEEIIKYLSDSLNIPKDKIKVYE